MTLPLDHVVILVADLDRAIADYTTLGFTVQRGGTHAAGTTHNALVGFADGSYLELIAFLKPDPTHRWGAFAARGHEGFVDFALLPPSVGEVVARAQAAGVAYQGPFDGGRTTLDGQVLKWQIGTPPSADLPFLCGDITPRALRVREGEVRVHPNGITGIQAMVVGVHDRAASQRRYAALLGQPAGPGTQVKLADTEVTLVQGTEAEGVRQLTFAGPVTVDMPTDLTHGANMRVRPV
jgi:catechol 2,3-dioxygenase-like lactoylglutathione lyase family enzyme